jgi:hypothetical protein
VYIPDCETSEINYMVAEDLVDWLTKTTYLTIHGGFKDASSSDADGIVGNERTWSLLRRMMANFKALERLEISREGWGLFVPPLFEWILCP